MPTENERVSGRNDEKRPGGTSSVARTSRPGISLGVSQITSMSFSPDSMSRWNQRSNAVLPLPRGPVSTALRGAPLPLSR